MVDASARAPAWHLRRMARSDGAGLQMGHMSQLAAL
jgi:hypothetical protein